MNKTTEALKLAEEALNAMLTHMGMDEDEWTKPTFNQAREALAAIREALAEQEKQEPVAWLNPHNQAVIDVRKKKQIGEGKGYPNFSIPLYAAPLDTKAIRAEALEEAAKVCRTAQAKGLQSIREAIEAAIRRLK